MCENNFFGWVRGIQRVGSGQIDDVKDLPLHIYFTVGVLDGGSRKI